MPTLDEAVKKSLLIRIGGNLKPDQQPCRRLFAVPEVISWMKKVLKDAKTDGYTLGAMRPVEQVLVLCNRFVAGEDFDWPLPHPMQPDCLGIYRVRTDDVRLNGWFPETCSFIIGSADLKMNCYAFRDKELMSEALSERDKLKVNEGHFLTGDYHDHI